MPVVTAVPVDVAGIRVAALPGEAAETVVIVVVVKTCRTLIPNTNFLAYYKKQIYTSRTLCKTISQ